MFIAMINPDFRGETFVNAERGVDAYRKMGGKGSSC